MISLILKSKAALSFYKHLAALRGIKRCSQQLLVAHIVQQFY